MRAVDSKLEMTSPRKTNSGSSSSYLSESSDEGSECLVRQRDSMDMRWVHVINELEKSHGNKVNNEIHALISSGDLLGLRGSSVASAGGMRIWRGKLAVKRALQTKKHMMRLRHYHPATSSTCVIL